MFLLRFLVACVWGVLVGCREEVSQPRHVAPVAQAAPAVNSGQPTPPVHANVPDATYAHGFSLVEFKRELESVGSGAKRNELLRSLVSSLTSEELLNMIVSNEALFSRQDLAGTEMLATQISKCDPMISLSLVQQLKNREMRQFLFDSMATSLSKASVNDVLKISESIASPDVIAQFYTSVAQMKTSVDFSSAAQEISQLRSTLLAKQHVDPLGLANSFVFDSVAKLSESQIGAAYLQLDQVTDLVVRKKLSQGMINAYFQRDSLAATEWLNNQPPSTDKLNAISALIPLLKLQGENEAVGAWESEAQRISSSVKQK